MARDRAQTDAVTLLCQILEVVEITGKMGIHYRNVGRAIDAALQASLSAAHEYPMSLERQSAAMAGALEMHKGAENGAR